MCFRDVILGNACHNKQAYTELNSSVLYCTYFLTVILLMSRPTRAILNWSNFRHNYELARKLADGLAYAVIKANGYGHGLLNCAQALSTADGFAVACVDEAIVLREGGVQRPILVLQGAYDASEWQLAGEYDLKLVVHHAQQLAVWHTLENKRPVSVFLKINSGMNRVGFSLAQADNLLAQIAADPNLTLVAVMTHFASADEADSAAYMAQLKAMASRTWPAPLTLCNSAALYRVRATAGTALPDAISRPGIMLYGGSPLLDKTAEDLGLKAVMTLQSELINIHSMATGERIGYGGDWQAKRDTQVGVVAIGYGDGYPRHAPNGTPVLVDGVECPLIGRVSMDMITVDITDHPSAQIGSSVELWGEQLSADRIAALCGTISYELFCQVTPRVKRVAHSV